MASISLHETENRGTEEKADRSWPEEGHTRMPYWVYHDE